MDLVVDTNILISAIVKSSKSKTLISSPLFNLYAPEHLIEEIMANKCEILDKSGLDNNDFELLLAILLSRITIVSTDYFRELINLALSVVSHPEDAPFIALSLFKKTSLWSDDKALKKQSLVKVFSTSELIKEFEL